MATPNKPSKPQYPWEVPVTSPGISSTSKTRGFLTSIFGTKEERKEKRAKRKEAEEKEEKEAREKDDEKAKKKVEEKAAREKARKEAEEKEIKEEQERKRIADEEKARKDAAKGKGLTKEEKLKQKDEALLREILAEQGSGEKVVSGSSKKAGSSGVEVGEQKKGREYFAEKEKISTLEKGPLYEHLFNLKTLIRILRDYRQSKIKGRMPILDKINLPASNLIGLLQAVLTDITKVRVEEGQIVRLVDTKEIDIFFQLFGLKDSSSSKEIDDAIKKFINSMLKFPGWKNFCSSGDVASVEQNNVALEIYGMLTALKQIENIENENPASYKQKREEIINSANLPNKNGESLDVDAIRIVLTPSQQKAVDETLKDEHFAELHDKADIGFLNALESAFRMRADLFEAIKEHDFGGKSLLEIRRDLNEKFPGKQLGGLFMIITQSDNKTPLLKLIAEYFGITTKNALFDQIQKINKVIGELYPNIASGGTGPVTGTGSDDLFNV